MNNLNPINPSSTKNDLEISNETFDVDVVENVAQNVQSPVVNQSIQPPQSSPESVTSNPVVEPQAISSNDSVSETKRYVYIIIGVVLTLLVVSGGIYWFFSRDKKDLSDIPPPPPMPSAAPATSTEPLVTSLATPAPVVTDEFEEMLSQVRQLEDATSSLFYQDFSKIEQEL